MTTGPTEPPPEPATREVLLTLTPRQYEEMGEQLERIKAELGTDSNTVAIAEAVRWLAGVRRC